MNQGCLDTLKAILGRDFVSNQELAILQKECDKHLECKNCRFHKEEN